MSNSTKAEASTVGL